jgi:uncharacterized membrane protein HdeD (DUF308 family)
MEALARNAWMMAIRGSLAILFGFALLMPGVTLPIAVLLFGAYAMVDGVWTMSSVLWTVRPAIGSLAMIAEGLVSLAIGMVALTWPMVPRDVIHLVAGWGVMTGMLEIVAAAAIPRERVASWLLGTAGVTSLFLAILIQMLPGADVARVVYVVAGYAIVFGVVVMLAARAFRREYLRRPSLGAHQRAAWGHISGRRDSSIARSR